MNSNFSLIIDFDSTIINLETLEFLASFSLQGNNQKHNIIQKISHYTDLAMNGEITFQESLNLRLKLMGIHKNDIDKAINLLNDKLDLSFLKNIDFFKRNISPLSFLVMVSHVKIRFNPTEIDQKANKLTMSPIPKNPKE